MYLTLSLLHWHWSSVISTGYGPCTLICALALSIVTPHYWSWHYLVFVHSCVICSDCDLAVLLCSSVQNALFNSLIEFWLDPFSTTRVALCHVTTLFGWISTLWDRWLACYRPLVLQVIVSTLTLFCILHLYHLFFRPVLLHSAFPTSPLSPDSVWHCLVHPISCKLEFILCYTGLHIVAFIPFYPHLSLLCPIPLYRG